MADTAELLALMTSHGIDPTKVVTGGTPALTAQDVAGAMGMGKLPRHEALLLLVKYCDEKSMKHELWAFWFKRVMQEKVADGWKTRAGQCRFLSDLSLDESIGTNVCSACGGSDMGDCRMCDGTGRRYESERRLMKGFQVAEKTFRQQWLGRIAWARRELQIWELNGLASLRSALG